MTVPAPDPIFQVPRAVLHARDLVVHTHARWGCVAHRACLHSELRCSQCAGYRCTDHRFASPVLDSRNLLERPPGAPKHIGRVRGRPETISQEFVTTLQTDTPSSKSLTLELEKRRARRRARRRPRKPNGAVKHEENHAKKKNENRRKMLPRETPEDRK